MGIFKGIKNIFSNTPTPKPIERTPYAYVVCKEVTYTQREIIWKLVKDHPEVIEGDASPTPYEILTDIVRWPHFFIEENPLRLQGISHCLFFDKSMGCGFYDNVTEIHFTEFIDKIYNGVWKIEDEIRMNEYRKLQETK